MDIIPGTSSFRARANAEIVNKYRDMPHWDWLSASLMMCLLTLMLILHSMARMSGSGRADCLKTIPGPFLSKYSSLRNLYHAWKGDLPSDVVSCHQTYGTMADLQRPNVDSSTELTAAFTGPVVRYAPSRLVFNTLSAARSKLSRHIYESGAALIV